MTTKIIAYGRISSRGQQETQDNMYQRTCIAHQFPDARLDFRFDQCSGSTPLASRSAFLKQLKRAERLGLPLVLEHPDRIFKTYSGSVIDRGYNLFQRTGTQFHFVYPNTRFHKTFWKILSGTESDTHKNRNLVRRVEQHLVYRNRILAGSSDISTLPGLSPFKTLEKLPYFHLLEECVGHIFSLVSIPDESRRNFFLDAYLGRAYNRKYIEHYAIRGKRKSVHIGQRRYDERPEEEELSRIIHRLEQTQNFTLDGRPKPVSNQAIANYLNRNTNFRNMRGQPFSAKNVFDRRRSQIYRQIVEGTFVVPTLPNLDD